MPLVVRPRNKVGANAERTRPTVAAVMSPSPTPMSAWTPNMAASTDAQVDVDVAAKSNWMTENERGQHHRTPAAIPDAK